MARAAKSVSIEEVVAAAVEKVAARMLDVIDAHIAGAVAAAVLGAAKKKGARSGRAAGREGKRIARRPARQDITKWVADRRARRVPNFVIDQTGLKTKKTIVAKYGANAAFEKGKAPPKPAEAAPADVKPATTKAKGPTVRKKAKAAEA